MPGDLHRRGIPGQSYRGLRLALETLRIIHWPFETSMEIIEECDGWRQTHVLDNWMYLGSWKQASAP